MVKSQPCAGGANIGKLGEQIAVGSDPVRRHFSICEDRDEAVEDVVGQCPAIARIGCRARGVEAHGVRQERPCYPPCCLRRIPSYVLQRVRKDGDETGVVCRCRGEVSSSLVAGKEDSLRRPRATICLNPASACAVYGSSPKAKHFGPERGVGHFQHNAAHVFVDEAIVAGELKFVQGASHVKEEGITTPAGEKAVVASFGYPCLPVHRDRRSFDDYLPAVVGPRRLVRPRRGATLQSAPRL